ncbi:MAG TPA: ribosome recycling factor [Candidatus Udaeobacter sp.]|jgi:ribosome recycling factor|nr:ribosome recycling factor [Candidatus Udaeobacter sp.]
MTHKMVGDAEERMKKVMEATRKELAGIRSGKATPALLDTVRVEAYGQPVPLNQVGTVTAPEARLLVVQPWDRSLLKAISRAIQLADLGLNPTDDGTVVRVPIPMLTEERRRDMVKLISKLAEEGRVHVRQVRHDALKDLKSLESGGHVSEDETKRLGAEIQKLTDRTIAQVDELLKKKTAEVMEV